MHILKIDHWTRRFCMLSIIFVFIFSGMTVAWSGNLFIDPASPLVAVGEEITLSVTNASGDVRWFAFDGEIQGEGNTIVYHAPDSPMIAGVTAQDSAGNIGTVSVVVMEKEDVEERFLRENANWEIFTDRSSVKAILLSDDKETLWVGTEGGLEERNACTGELKRVYKNQDGLPYNNISALASDGSGGIWVGTYGGGLAHLSSQGSWEVFDQDSSCFPSNDITSLVSDGSGDIWVGTKGGLAHINSQGICEFFDTGNSDLPSYKVKSIALDGSGGIWVGTSGGLAHLNHQGIGTVFNQDNSDLPSNDIQSLVSDGLGGIWIGTWGGDIAHFNSQGNWVVIDDDSSDLTGNTAYSLIPNTTGKIWVATASGLANINSQGVGEVFDSRNSDLPSSTIYALSLDGSGGLWVGTDGGLAHFNSQGSWEIFDKERSDLPCNDIYALLLYGLGGLWVGTDGGGLAHLSSQGNWTRFNEDNSDLPSNNIESIASDDSGGLWVGTLSTGLAHLNSQGNWTLFNEDNSDLPSNHNITSLVSDGSGGIWVGTLTSGLSHLNAQGNGTCFNEDNSDLPRNWVSGLISDGSGGVWVDTYNRGVVHITSQDKCTVFNEDNSDLPDDDVRSILLEDSGGIWFGTNYGLAHLSFQDRWTVFYESNSDLPNNHVYSLVSDGSGGIWMETFTGLAHLNSQGNWTAFDEDNSDLVDNHDVSVLVSDGALGIWVGTEAAGLAHLTYSSGTINNEQYLTGKRAAIIVSGGGNTDDNMLWDSTEKISNYTYKMLNRRGFLNTDIYYISPKQWADFNGDGLDDNIVDAPDPARPLVVEDIQAAFDWAKERGELNQPLYIFFTDHGGNNRLQLANGVYIEAAELKQMLDDYQQSTGNKVIFVIDACHSGTLVESLAAPDRAIISSTDDGLAYFDRYDDQSFTYFLTKGLFKGMNYLEAFHYAESKQKKLLGKLSDYATVAGDNPGDLSQEPQYDDTGDGVYVVAEEGEWLKKVSINGNVTVGDITLQVEPVTASGIISANSALDGDAKILKAKATLVEGRVKSVWAVIHPPRMDIIVDDTGIPLLPFPRAQLRESESENQIWEGSYDGFIYNGEYDVTFYAEDNSGFIENSDTITLTVTGGLALPDRASVELGISSNTIQSTDLEPGSFSLSVTEKLSYGYDLYVGIFFPDGRFVTFDGSNNYNDEWYRIEKWWPVNREQGRGVTVLDDVDMLKNLPVGEYQVYAVLAPENENILNTVSNWVWDFAGFKVQ
ncbi:Two-component system sensor histidine kinase/response regulator [Desulfamplus magnetovallimortis]|uniref:Two-component system sensor histidine kinase/response regulator n=1 Tax=Desulfamplus magnetovallimortis TaxID=1246637 RepID=A0A1W1HEE2_9BACT|nr:two-component regulator propeller domain-containing protein [Desulfamplus magnetovallimortis]SLM30806.1 Two-component system sensor histidine kinase/response regulator [Desulfamplus magnetovallimortis]